MLSICNAIFEGATRMLRETCNLQGFSYGTVLAIFNNTENLTVHLDTREGTYEETIYQLRLWP